LSELTSPTCTEAGRQTLTCNICNTVDVIDLPALGHMEGPGKCLTCGVAIENKIKNVIYIIGDGMGKEHIAAGEKAYGEHFEFTDWTMASSSTNSLDGSGRATVLTDSAASGTALATGVLTVNGYIGRDRFYNDQPTLLDFAADLDKSTGILTTDTLYGATPGSFSAHSNSRYNTSEIVASQIRSGVDFLAGYYDKNCTSQRADIEDHGYTYVETLKAAKAAIDAEKMYCQLLLEGNNTSSSAVKLADAAKVALDFLDDDEDGFVLMIEQAHIDKCSHSNDFAGMVKNMKSLDETVDAVMEWIGDRTDTIVVITADHETGGLCTSAKQGVLEKTYTGPNGDKVYYSFHTTGHTDADVGVFLYGTSFDFSTLPFFKSSHIVKNSDIPEMIKRILLRE
ncbi:MAG: alkaline phosphatase, partial [Clostridia bacterium]|nr:alkaline phosphatase [Clostridia bacterium]